MVFGFVENERKCVNKTLSFWYLCSY